MCPNEQQMLLIACWRQKTWFHLLTTQPKRFDPRAGGKYHRGSIHASHTATPGLNRGSVDIFTAQLLQLFRSNEISFLSFSLWIVKRSNPSSA